MEYFETAQKIGRLGSDGKTYSNSKRENGHERKGKRIEEKRIEEIRIEEIEYAYEYE